MRQLDSLQHGPKKYVIATPAPPQFPWERSPTDVLGQFSSTLNLPLLRTWAAKYLTGNAKQFAIQCYTTGFPSHNQQPHHTDITAPNRVSPDTPEGDAVDAQLARLQARNRVTATSLPRLPGTRVIPLSCVTKVKVAETTLLCKLKHRPIIDGAAPHDGTDRKAWIDTGDISYTVNYPLIAIVAHILTHDIVSGSLHDYEAYFESLPKPLTEVAHTTLWWRNKFHYVHDHLYGEAATPHSAELHATVLQAAQQDAIDRVTTQHHLIVRRCDDSLILHPSNDQESISRANEAFVLTSKMVNQQLQQAKTLHEQPCVLFDGILIDFANKRIGYPVSKQLRLVCTIGRALGWPDSSTLDIIPKLHQAAAKNILTAHDKLNRHRGHRLNKTQAQSITGSLEYALTVLVNMRARVPPIRACYQHNTTPHALVTLTPEARSALAGFHKLFAKAQPIWYSMRALFERPHSQEIVTDASGKSGFGGYTTSQNRLFFSEDLPISWNMHLDVMPPDISSTWLELATLFLVLHCRQMAKTDQVFLWTTDCHPAEQAWRQGRSPSPACNDLIWRIQRLLTARGTTIISRHVKRELNQLADILSKQDIATFLAKSPEHTALDRVRIPPLAFIRLGRTLTHRGQEDQ